MRSDKSYAKLHEIRGGRRTRVLSLYRLCYTANARIATLKDCTNGAGTANRILQNNKQINVQTDHKPILTQRTIV